MAKHLNFWAYKSHVTFTGMPVWRARYRDKNGSPLTVRNANGDAIAYATEDAALRAAAEAFNKVETGR